MSDSFLIISGDVGCSLKRRGELTIQRFPDVAQTLAHLHRHLDQPADVTITDQMSGATRRLKIDPASPLASAA